MCVCSQCHSFIIDTTRGRGWFTVDYDKLLTANSRARPLLSRDHRLTVILIKKKKGAILHLGASWAGNHGYVVGNINCTRQLFVLFSHCFCLASNGRTSASRRIFLIKKISSKKEEEKKATYRARERHEASSARRATSTTDQLALERREERRRGGQRGRGRSEGSHSERKYDGNGVERKTRDCCTHGQTKAWTRRTSAAAASRRRGHSVFRLVIAQTAWRRSPSPAHLWGG